MIFENMRFKDLKHNNIRDSIRSSIRGDFYNRPQFNYFNEPESNNKTESNESNTKIVSDNKPEFNAYDKLKSVFFTKLTAQKKSKVPASSPATDVKELDDLEEVIEIAGYAYDEEQDIFYSVMDPWQRKVGYCRLYDEASAPLGMIIDCEPVYFEYDNRKWMISFWKGQYDLVSGAEIGIYTSGKELTIPGIFHGTFYNSVSDNERLQMSYTLYKNGKVLFTRNEVHWWLTGFKLGDFAEPSELTMDISVTFKNAAMRDAFLVGFRKAGYKEKDFTVDGNTVSFLYDKPHARQPITRTKETDKIIQAKNKLLCGMYQEITRSGETAQEKIKVLKEQSPELYAKLLKIGKNKQIIELFYMLIMVIMFLLSIFSTSSNSIFSLKKPSEILSN